MPLSRRHQWAALLLLLAVGIGLRAVAASKTGLSVDEIFTLAMATGHSLEHPAGSADAVRGDYIETPGVRAPREIRRYAQHEVPAAGPGRVVRAVLLSDTSPPLYYLVVSAWTRVAGTSDLALRLLSTLFYVACVPLIVSIGDRLAGRPTAWIGALIFTLSPAAIFYGAEARMYALLFLCTLALIRLTLGLAERGARPAPVVGWIAVASVGLLSHYFFVFILVACTLWLVGSAAQLRRALPVGQLLVVGLLVSPWYARIPESLAAWRVTAGWQDVPLGWNHVATVPGLHLWSYISGYWGFGVSFRTDLPALLFYGVLLLLALRRDRRRLVAGPQILLWLCMLGAIFGLLTFDLLRGSRASFVLRYSLAALPAAHLVIATWIGILGHRLRLLFVLLVLATFVPGWRALATVSPRPDHGFPVVARELDAWAGRDDLVVVHSIPSGVIGVARYMRSDAPILSWVPQLERRDTSELEALVRDRCRVALVTSHTLGEAVPAEAWLADALVEVRRQRVARKSEIVLFRRNGC